MTDLQPRLTRRALLGVAVVAVAGCHSHHRSGSADPDAAAVEAARAGELALLAASREGSPEHAAHLAHLQALGGSLPSAGASRGVATPAVTPAYADSRGSVTVLQTMATRARSADTAAALASIAASHAVLTAGSA